MFYLAKNPYLVIFILTLAFNFFFSVLGLGHPLYRGAVSVGFATLLSPRKKIIETQSGAKTQITWLFLKKPIIID